MSLYQNLVVHLWAQYDVEPGRRVDVHVDHVYTEPSTPDGETEVEVVRGGDYEVDVVGEPRFRRFFERHHPCPPSSATAMPAPLKTCFLFRDAAQGRDPPDDRACRGVPVDEINRPRGSWYAALRIPPSEAQVGLTQVRPGPAAELRAGKLMAEVGLRVNEVCQLDLDDVRWDLGRFGKIHVRMGKGARWPGPAPASAWSRSSTTPG